MGSARPTMRPWRFVLALGAVSLLADMVYEGARSIIGPYLATLGASALVVGLVAGAGEFIGYGLRVVSGYLVRRSRHYWTWTIAGYALTVLSVPLLGATSTLIPALLLYGGERLGKAVRSPAKDTLLSFASIRTGPGMAFGVHQGMDQAGAMLGPLLLAAVLATHEGNYRLAFGVLAVPGVVVLLLLFWLRRRVPDPLAYEAGPEGDRATEAPDGSAEAGTDPGLDAHGERLSPTEAGHRERRARMPRRLWQYVGAIALLSAGVASFPLLAFHAQETGLLTPAQIPLLFALAMLIDGLTGPVAGWVYDRRGAAVLYAVPVAAGLASMAFVDNALLVWLGVAIWGVVNGVLDSTVKAVITTLVGPDARSVAFGWLAFVRGLGLLIAGGVLGAAYGQGATLVVVLIVAINVSALIGLTRVLPATRPADAPSG